MKLVWTKEKCKEEALKYISRNEFRLNSNAAYRHSCSNRWLSEITTHMKIRERNYMYWTKNVCHTAALTCNSRSIFLSKYGIAYDISRKNGWLDDICSHMVRTNGHSIDMTIEDCKNQALQYKTRTEFLKYSQTAYHISRKNKWLDSICSHMVVCGNMYKRMIYKITFSDNCVYVGLTYNYEKRMNVHLKDGKSPVYKHAIKTGLIPTCEKLTGYVDREEAQLLENYWIENCKNEGCIILNSTKGGNLGGNNLKWTFEKCKESSLLCKTTSEFRKRFSGAVASSRKNGWYVDITSHLIKSKLPNGYWSLEKCKNEALIYKTRRDFELGSVSAYNKCVKNKWLDVVCLHMKK